METQLSQHESDGDLDIELLLAACQRGDSSAWDVLIDRFERLVFAIALREGLSHEDAADVTQAAFEALISALPRIETGTSVGAWLASVARRLAWRQQERRRREDSNLRRHGHQLVVEAGHGGPPGPRSPTTSTSTARSPMSA